MLIEYLHQLRIASTTGHIFQMESNRRICAEYQDILKLRRTVWAIVEAAEREGGIHCLNLCGRQKRFRDSIVDIA